MKKIILFRHGRAEAGGFDIDDFDRALANSGIKDVNFMAKKLIDNNLIPGLIISSGAKRAKQTAEIIAAKTKVTQPIIDIFWLYTGFVTAQFMDLINNLSEEFNTVAIVGHNTYISEAAIKLCKDFRINFPTSGNLTVGFKVDKWSEIEISQGEQVSFEYPK